MCALRSTYCAVTSCPWLADESIVPSCPSCTIALSKFAAGMRIVNEPLSPPSVDEDRIEPPFTAAMCATGAGRCLERPVLDRHRDLPVADDLRQTRGLTGRDRLAVLLDIRRLRCGSRIVRRTQRVSV